MRRRRRDSAPPVTSAGVAARAEINVTPLIDVLLVLLILFLLISHAAHAQIDTGLARTGPVAGPAPDAMSLSVRDTDVVFEGMPILDLAGLQSALTAALDGRADRPLWVRVSPGVSYERLVAVLDAVREAGATRIGILPASPP